MKCSQCGIELNRELTIVGTVINITEDEVLLSITEPEERLNNVNGGKPYAFPFVNYTPDGKQISFCTLNCFKEHIYETIER